MRLTKPIIFLLIAAALTTSAALWFFRKDEPEQATFVERRTFSKEIFAIGKVKPAEELKLSFNAGGIISGIYVKEGEFIEKGKVLAELDTEELESRVREAQAQLALQESSLATAQVQLQNAKGTLFIRIRDAYNKIEEAFFSNAEPLFSGGTFGLSIQEGSVIYSFNTPEYDLRHSLNTERKELLSLIPQWKQPISKNELLKETELVLERLESLRDFIDDLARAVSHFSTDKTSIATVLNSHRSSVSSAQSLISLAIINLDSALQSLTEAESNVSAAGVVKAKREIETLQVQLNQTRLTATFNGTILTKQASAREVVRPGDVIFTFYPEDPLIVEAEIYEGDIGSIFVNQSAKLEFIAFPGKTFEGYVIKIDRAPVLIDGVVHYLATLRIIDSPDQILPSMSVDVRFAFEQK